MTGKVTENKGTWKLDDSHFDKVEHFEYKAATTKVENGTITEYLTTAKYVNTDNKTETGSKQTINGQEVQGLDIIEKYDYNDYNRQTKIGYDNNGDGTADKIHYQQFDSLGRVQKVLVDNDAKKPQVIIPTRITMVSQLKVSTESKLSVLTTKVKP